ncbi:MAG TPA: hemerythrin domain-containing protein [Usitatibacter sp.]|nr:hemerythrin domain-containing protein [Usitatibacter sp.]
MAISRPRKANAIDLLKKDHSEVQDLFAEFRRFHEEETEGVEELMQELVDEVCAALKVHTQIEEEIFYPAAREACPGEDEMFDEALAEHSAAKDLIEQIEGGAASDPSIRERFLALSDAIDHHVREEETEMFPKLLETSMDMEEVGARLAERKRVLENEAARSDGAIAGEPKIPSRIPGLRG